MKKKILIQVILLLVAVLFISLFYFQYIFKKSEDVSQKQDVPYLNIDSNSSNIIKSIEYVVDDKFGNKYLITAEYGEILENDNNLILMQNVKAFLNFNDEEAVTITSSSALYNISEYDTKFKKNIYIEYGEHEIYCDRLDFLFNEQKIKLYDNINYDNLNTNLLADKMEIDLLSKNTKIYMKNDNEKIKITYKDKNNL